MHHVQQHSLAMLAKRQTLYRDDLWKRLDSLDASQSTEAALFLGKTRAWPQEKKKATHGHADSSRNSPICLAACGHVGQAHGSMPRQFALEVAQAVPPQALAEVYF